MQVATRFLRACPLICRVQFSSKRTAISSLLAKRFVTQSNAAEYETTAEANWKARCELAACYRILFNLNFHEGVCNHLSLSCPAKDGSGKVMLIIPFGLHWREVTASKLLGVSLNKPQNPEVTERYSSGEPDISAVSIHNGIHHSKAGTDITCILHTHVPYATALTCIEGQELEMCHQNSARFHEELCYDNEYDGLADCLDEGFRLGKLLGNRTVMMMGNHGVLVLGRTVSEAFDQMFYLERAAQVQVLAMSTGKKLSIIGDKLVEKNKQFHRENFRHYADSNFDAWKRLIEKEEPSYKS